MKKPINVLQIALSLVFGGTEKLVYDIVRHVDKHKVRPVVCCLDEFGHFGEVLKNDGRQVYQLHRVPGVDWTLIPKLYHIIQDERIDVIHAQQYTPYFYGLLASLYCKLRGAVYRPKLVFTEHGIAFPYRKKWKRRLVNPFLSLFTHEIIAISQSLKENLAIYENFPTHRIKVIYNGIDLQRFSLDIDPAVKKRSIGISHDGPLIGIVARLHHVKNHPLLLRAFKNVLEHAPQASLLIVGDGPDEDKLKRLALSLELGEKAVFLGARDDIPELLQVFDIFVLPSFSEGTSVSLLEAMASSLPIVATRVGGNSEVVIDQETAFLVESDNEDEMAAMILKLLFDEELRHRMGKAGRKRVHELFSLENMVKTYTDVYYKAVDGKRSS
ncbi:glycosyl transferase family 1 [candidate division KSB3 bacterium]|uniref:Glycosyl transferase family 1 n=1 Tax=candidate division KSB3 bacterium TaxID=2044937 RepID=A0A2G6E847_9BACT|nr:MAG: glycosyl transferase family 1 [candidate division KSB3 bacterium]PIE30406.1 MAG: glycosyl transferase family 1 [candidate division KSB3 bacterium]